MKQHWQEVLPIDQYYVRANGILHEYDRKIIALLYQPLIGAVAHSLYMTWWSELENNKLWSTNETHHSLMSMLDLPLNTIFEAREKLEAIGLVKTYEKLQEDSRVLIYELQPPLMPDVFFTDGMLSIFLYKQVGSKKYNKLKDFFTEKTEIEVHDFKNVTKAFTDVFHSIGSMSMNEKCITDEPFVGRQKSSAVKVEKSDFNFGLLEAGLVKAIFPKEALTEEVKEAIRTLHFLYGIDPLTIQGHLLEALDETMEVNIVRLRKSVRDWYTLVNNQELPSLVYRAQMIVPAEDKYVLQLTEHEKDYVKFLEGISPADFLTTKMDGAKPSDSELKVIEEIMINQKLPSGVMNVLIDYVLQKNQNRLPKNYLEAIASTWAKNKIKTAAHAFVHLKTEKETQKIQEEQRSTKPKKSNLKRKVTRSEIMPDWIGNKEDSTNTKQLDEAERIRLTEALKNLKINKGSK